MTDRYYPELPDGAVNALNMVRLQLSEDPGYLDSPDCPYDRDEVRLLLKMFAAGAVLKDMVVGGDSGEGTASESISDDAITDRVDELFKQLKTFGKDIEDNKDPKDRAAYFRVAVALTDKIVDLRERAYRLKEWKSFYAHLMNWLETLDPDLRTEFMDRIKDWD